MLELTPIEEKTQADYDAIAAQFFASRKDMHWPILDLMIEQVQPGQRVLDIGCGTGRLCVQLAPKGVDYEGIDISKEEIAIAKDGCDRGHFQIGSMRNLPYADNTFDHVFCIAVLHHLLTKEERIRSLEEAFRVLKPGGKLHLTNMGLWQKKYWPLFFSKKAGKRTMPFPQTKQLKWNDVFIPWKWKSAQTVHRYYHAFTKRELRALLSAMPAKDIKIFYERGGKSVRFYRARNIVVEAQKKV